jgi:hypothetical protein
VRSACRLLGRSRSSASIAGRSDRPPRLQLKARQAGFGRLSWGLDPTGDTSAPGDWALRSVDPARRCGQCFHRQRPTCRSSICLPRSFLILEGSAVDVFFAPSSLGTANRGQSGCELLGSPVRAIRARPTDAPVGPILPWALASLRFSDATMGAPDETRSSSGHQAPARHGRRRSIRSWASSGEREWEHKRQVTADAGPICPSPALQRIEEADAWLVHPGSSARMDQLPV